MDSVKKFLKSFYYAAEGIKTGTKQRNFRIHIYVFIFVLFAGTLLDISSLEWLLIILVSALVLSTELLNTAVEEICNILSKKIKLKYLDTWDPRNLAAAAVFISAIAAALIGLAIFVPKIASLFR